MEHRFQNVSTVLHLPLVKDVEDGCLEHQLSACILAGGSGDANFYTRPLSYTKSILSVDTNEFYLESNTHTHIYTHKVSVAPQREMPVMSMQWAQREKGVWEGRQRKHSNTLTHQVSSGRGKRVVEG